MAKLSTTSPIITLVDDVEKCEKEILDSLFALADKRSCKIVINSGGGSVYASLGIATVIKMKQLAAEAVVLADCSSAAITVFAACQVRRVAPHASFLFHPMKWASEDQSRLTGARSWAVEFSRVNQVYEDFLVENLPIKRRLLRSWMKEEKYVQAAELFELGVAEPLEFPQEGVIDISAKVRKGSRRAQKLVRPARIRKVG